MTKTIITDKKPSSIKYFIPENDIVVFETRNREDNSYIYDLALWEYRINYKGWCIDTTKKLFYIYIMTYSYAGELDQIVFLDGKIPQTSMCGQDLEAYYTHIINTYRFEDCVFYNELKKQYIQMYWKLIPVIVHTRLTHIKNNMESYGHNFMESTCVPYIMDTADISMIKKGANLYVVIHSIDLSDIVDSFIHVCVIEIKYIDGIMDTTVHFVSSDSALDNVIDKKGYYMREAEDGTYLDGNMGFLFEPGQRTDKFNS